VTTARPFTLVMAYYDNPNMLIEQRRRWTELPDRIAQALHVVIVDDGSPRWPARDILPLNTWGNHPASRYGSVQLFQMKQDVPWNQDACRNLGVKFARTEWVLLTDMDHVVPRGTWDRLMFGPLLNKAAYRFARVSMPECLPYKYHPNTWAMRAKCYWQCGGYDERLAGNYGTDGDFLIRVRARLAIEDLPQTIIRYPREVIPDASTTTLERKRADEKDNIRRLVGARGPDWKPLHFSFPYERVL